MDKDTMKNLNESSGNMGSSLEDKDETFVIEICLKNKQPEDMLKKIFSKVEIERNETSEVLLILRFLKIQPCRPHKSRWKLWTMCFRRLCQAIPEVQPSFGCPASTLTSSTFVFVWKSRSTAALHQDLLQYF